MRSRVQDEPGQYGETPFTKNIKISKAWWHRPVVPATWEVERIARALDTEVAMSPNSTTVLQPGHQSDTLFLK